MRIAISGSSGLIGKALGAALRARGDTVMPVVRRAAGVGEIEWDLVAGTIDAAAFEEIDTVVHLAGAGIAEKRWSPARKALIRSSRIDGTRLLSRTLAGLKGGPTVLISGSAIGYYGDGGAAVLTEQSQMGEGFLSELVRDWEAQTEDAERAGVRVAHLRSAMVLSESGGALAKMLPLFRAGLGGRIGNGQQYWSWISLDDAVGAILLLIESPSASGPFNLSAPQPVTNSDFTRILGAVLGRPTLLPVPSFGPKLVLGSELAQNLLLTSARVEPSALIGAGYDFQHADLKTALRSLLKTP